MSTKRATAIVTILSENKAINKKSLTAAGRGEFSPLATNETAEGKAKNRRIEIILTPRLDEIAEMLNEINRDEVTHDIIAWMRKTLGI